MGSPISGFIAEAVLQKLEKIVMEGEAPRLWLRYVNDTFVIVKRSEKAKLFVKINGILPGIQFTEDEENANQLPSLDVLVQRSQEGVLKTTVYRNPTHTY